MNRNVWMIFALVLTIGALESAGAHAGDAHSGKEERRALWAHDLGQYPDGLTDLFWANGHTLAVTQIEGVTNCANTLDAVSERQEFLWQAASIGFEDVNCGDITRRITLETPPSSNHGREDMAENRY